MSRVTRGIVSATWHYNVTCQCYYQMSLCWFRFSPIYIFLFQFNTYVCVSDL